jgi:hypothetical protein
MNIAMRYGTAGNAGNASSAETIVSGADYIKFPDGTMMQWSLVSVTAAASANGSSVWTFSQPFIDTDYLVQTTAQLGSVVNTRALTMASGRNTTDVTIYWRNNSNASYTMQVACLAIGKWK